MLLQEASPKLVSFSVCLLQSTVPSNNSFLSIREKPKGRMHFKITSHAVFLGQINGPPFSTWPLMLLTDQSLLVRLSCRVEANNPGWREEVILRLCLDLIIPRCSKHCPSVVLEKQDITTCEKEQRQRRKPRGRRLTGVSEIGCRCGSRGRELFLIKTLIWGLGLKWWWTVLVNSKTESARSSSSKARKPLYMHSIPLGNGCLFV